LEVKAVREIDACRAEDKLSQLLDLVERGEEIVITRHGKAVARMVPRHKANDGEQARAAIRRIRERAEKLKLESFDWAEWKSYRDKGRP
jgi:prevent-host-death family protein